MEAATPMEILVLIALGGLLGAFGQGLRVVVGLKKVYDQAHADKTDFASLFDTSKLVVSLFIGFLAGGLAILFMDKPAMGKEFYTMLIGAGYAGADFIEGFVQKTLPSAGGGAGASPNPADRHPNNDAI
jgi:F0F1-type ATP synthase membrane subunit c/vacuolar-type H+-ATPase subunit K